jgi:hypothetical protein
MIGNFSDLHSQDDVFLSNNFFLSEKNVAVPNRKHFNSAGISGKLYRSRGPDETGESSRIEEPK